MPAANTNATKKPRAAAPKATKPKSAPAAAKSGKRNHVLTLTKDERALVPAWQVSRPDGSILGWFSTEGAINEKLEKAGDSRRLKHGKIVEVGE